MLTGLETFELPINPYSTVYWQPRPVEPPQTRWIVHTPMNPPRIPLTNISRSDNSKPIPSTFEPPKAPAVRTDISTPAKPSRAPKRLVGVDTIEAFKAAVAGSDLTKAGLVEVLKKQ